MAKALNRVTLLGNLGQDPELRSTPQGSSVCNLNIATSESYKDKNSGDWKEVTDWHRVVLWEGLADVASQYLKKGDKVYIEGKLKTRSYEQDGITKYITEVRATNMIMMGKSSGGGSGSYQSQDSYSQPQQSTQKDNYSANNDFDDIDDDGDVPF
jgi:single-strand DNA-binding protein